MSIEDAAPNPNCPGCKALQARVERLEALVAELTGRLNQNSSNSSRPPSSDPPSTPKHPAAPVSGRKRGGQPGHKGITRCLLPVEEVDEVVPCIPAHCPHCETLLLAHADDPEPLRHQVAELPPVRVQVTEYQLHARTCPKCRRRTWAALPAGVPSRTVGPRLQAVASVLSGGYHVSRRNVQELLRDLFAFPFSLGALAGLEADTAGALENAYREAGAAVAAAPVVYVDETPWREAAIRPWLWTAATPELAFFRIDDHRNAAAYAALLPPLPGPKRRTVVSDRYGVYTREDPTGRAVCWSHLKRDFQGRFDAGGKGRPVARWALDEITRLFHHWHAFRDEHGDRGLLLDAMRPVKARFGALLRWGSECGCSKTAGLCQNLLDQWPALWTFLYREGVEPTNNHAERVLRPAVIWRKTSFGTQGERGRRFTERLLTTVGSLRLQGRNVLEFLESACRAALAGSPSPSLLPPAMS